MNKKIIIDVNPKMPMFPNEIAHGNKNAISRSKIIMSALLIDAMGCSHFEVEPYDYFVRMKVLMEVFFRGFFGETNRKLYILLNH